MLPCSRLEIPPMEPFLCPCKPPWEMAVTPQMELQSVESPRVSPGKGRVDDAVLGRGGGPDDVTTGTTIIVDDRPGIEVNPLEAVYRRGLTALTVVVAVVTRRPPVSRVKGEGDTDHEESAAARRERCDVPTRERGNTLSSRRSREQKHCHVPPASRE